jgi:hypothetical protein
VSTTTIERPATITEAAPLTTSEVTSLIAMTAGNERTARVGGSVGTRTSRGWQMGGDVD